MPEVKPDNIGDGIPSVENDPEVLAEERRLRIKILRLRYYKEAAGTVKVLLQTFKTEATSLVSGIGTLVLGYYQVKKWILREHKAAAPAAAREMNRPAVVHKSAARSIRPTPTCVVSKSEELVSTLEPQPAQDFSADPMFYALILFGAAFGFATTKLVVGKARDFLDHKSSGGSNGPL